MEIQDDYAELKSTKTIVKIAYVGIDAWNRPIFKDIDSNTYFGSVTTLVPNKTLKTSVDIRNYFSNNISELEYFGSSFGCEPHGGLDSNITLIIIR